MAWHRGLQSKAAEVRESREQRGARGAMCGRGKTLCTAEAAALAAQSKRCQQGKCTGLYHLFSAHRHLSGAADLNVQSDSKSQAITVQWTSEAFSPIAPP